MIEQAKLIYKKVPTYEKGLLGLTKKYIGSEVMEDNIAAFFPNEKNFNKGYKEEHPKPAPEPASKTTAAPEGESSGTWSRAESGYCIRTGVQIPFNVKKPQSYEAYKAWGESGKKDDPEEFCHFSGEPSNGETSVSKPILKKNWKKAKAIFSL